ncbi:Conjugative transposon protein TraO [uncultured Prevotella sp.]|nr:Conjugative transposon protein TraO [uncultured Prevotella sp.]
MVMKKNNIILTACVAVAMTFSLPSQAQRLIPKQRGIEVLGSVPLIKGEKPFTGDNFGVGISLTRYLKKENYTFASLGYEQQNLPYRSYNIPMKDILLQVGYMHPVLSDRGKNVFLYSGISALGGYEQLNEGKKAAARWGDTARPLPLCLWRCRTWLGGSVSNRQGSLSCKGAGAFPIWNGRVSFPSGCFCRTKV